MIESRRMGWAVHVARMGEKRSVHRVLVGKPEGKRPLGRPSVDGRIILRWIFRKWDGGARTRLIWLGIGTGGGHL
jgi:hypothetical protein